MLVVVLSVSSPVFTTTPPFLRHSVVYSRADTRRFVVSSFHSNAKILKSNKKSRFGQSLSLYDDSEEEEELEDEDEEDDGDWSDDGDDEVGFSCFCDLLSFCFKVLIFFFFIW